MTEGGGEPMRVAACARLFDRPEPGVGDEAINLAREGLVRVDRWLSTFYLPEHTNARYS